MMRDAELELEAELEDLVRSISENGLEPEDEWEGYAGAVVPPGRCTPVGTRVGSLTCSPAEHHAIEDLLQMSIPDATLQEAVESAAAGAVSLATTAAGLLDIPSRTRASRVAFCAAFGVAPEFVPPWRATLHGVIKWRDLGELVAIRLRDIAKILDGGCIKYFCWGSPAHCPECTSPQPTYFACSSFLGRYLICLGAPFWQAWQLGDRVNTDLTLLHEALHIYFRRTVAHTGRSGNAFCYESFVIRMNGMPVPEVTTGACPTGACALTPPTILDRFAIDHTELQPFHTPLIRQVAKAVADSWKTASPILIIQLTGFADPTGPAAHNFDLGMGRALSVQNGIRKALGPALAGKVSFVPFSRGAQGPIASNATVAGRARNRRVEVSLLP
ncbi:MAG: OmpA family protein [Candidatus Sulfotelmatobacter sp.]|jgi:OmpA family protein